MKGPLGSFKAFLFEGKTTNTDYYADLLLPSHTTQRTNWPVKNTLEKLVIIYVSITAKGKQDNKAFEKGKSYAKNNKAALGMNPKAVLKFKAKDSSSMIDDAEAKHSFLLVVGKSLYDKILPFLPANGEIIFADLDSEVKTVAEFYSKFKSEKRDIMFNMKLKPAEKAAVKAFFESVASLLIAV